MGRVAKDDALRFLDRVRARVETMDDVALPEGEIGVTLHALMWVLSESCPDVGDFHLLRQSVDAAIHDATAELSRTQFTRR